MRKNSHLLGLSLIAIKWEVPVAAIALLVLVLGFNAYYHYKNAIPEGEKVEVAPFENRSSS
jgi:hypothetical protein